jgi:hypothetical protein
MLRLDLLAAFSSTLARMRNEGLVVFYMSVLLHVSRLVCVTAQELAPV